MELVTSMLHVPENHKFCNYYFNAFVKYYMKKNGDTITGSPQNSPESQVQITRIIGYNLSTER